MKHIRIMLLSLCLLWVVPCVAEESIIDKAYREARESTERVQQKMDRWNDGIRESERQQAEFERNYNRNDSGAKWRYNVDTDKSSWEFDNGMIIEDD